MGGACYTVAIDHFGLIFLFHPTNFSSKCIVGRTCKNVIFGRYLRETFGQDGIAACLVIICFFQQSQMDYPKEEWDTIVTGTGNKLIYSVGFGMCIFYLNVTVR